MRKRKKLMIIDTILIILNLSLFVTGLIKPIDEFVYNSIYIGKFTTPIFKLATSLSNTLPLCMLFAIAVVIIYKLGYKEDAKRFIGVFGASGLIMFILKNILRRPRPDINRLIKITGFSYPSGHSLMSFVFYGYIAYLLYKYYDKKNRPLLIFLLIMMILLIGYSRIYLGVHYFSDVIMGYSIGLFILLINMIFEEKENNFSKTIVK